MVRKFKINVNGKNYDVEVEEVFDNQPEVKKPEPILVKKEEAPAEIPQKAKEVPAPPSHVDGSIKINAPMPGTILKINIEHGQKVKKGEVLLILEAMKMENEVVAPRDGTVVSINVSKGARVNVGELMVSME